jgi:hypothetical protein
VRREDYHDAIRARLIDASNGNIDALADISPIRALIEQGCDLDADILPTVAGTVPELPRPLKNWGAKWLAQDILTARDRRLFSLVDARPAYAPLQPKVIAALLSAGATEEMISGAFQILGACTTRTIGRPRKYKNRAECDRAYKRRKKEREKTREDILARLYDAAQWQIELAPTSRRSLPSSTRAEPRRVPFDEARTVPRDEFVPMHGRQSSGARRSLNFRHGTTRSHVKQSDTHRPESVEQPRRFCGEAV